MSNPIYMSRPVTPFWLNLHLCYTFLDKTRSSLKDDWNKDSSSINHGDIPSLPLNIHIDSSRGAAIRLYVKEEHSCQGQISGFSGKQIPTVTPNKSGIVGPRSVSSPALYNYPPCAVKQLSEREDYQLTIIWPRRLSCDNYLSRGLSLKITREIPFRLFRHKILKWATLEMVIFLVAISMFSFVQWLKLLGLFH